MFQYQVDALRFFVSEVNIQFETLNFGLGRMDSDCFCILYNNIDSVQFTPFELYEQTLGSLEEDIQATYALDETDLDEEDYHALECNERAKDKLLSIKHNLISALKFKHFNDVDVVIFSPILLQKKSALLTFDPYNKPLDDISLLGLN